MNSSGYRGKNFGPWGVRTSGPPNGYNVPRFPHSNFNHPHLPHRLRGSDTWVERPNFPPRPQSNFFSHLQYRGNLQFRPNGRGRVAGGRGIIRFSGPGRPPIHQFYMGYKQNPISRVLPQKELINDKIVLEPQAPLLGSEEERLQKISETADKLKQKLSCITEEELTNFWEDDLSILSNNGSEEDNTQKKAIPELRHEPPELDLTFTDFRDIGRVDCNNSKVEDVDNKSNDEISITLEQGSVDKCASTNDEITIVHESKEKYSATFDLAFKKDDFNQSNALVEEEKYAKQIHNVLPELECNIKCLDFHDDNTAKDSNVSNSNNDKLSFININDKVTDSTPIELTNKIVAEHSLGVNDIKTASVSMTDTNIKDTLQVDISQKQNTVQINTQDENNDNALHTIGGVDHNHHMQIENLECNQIQNDSQINVPPETDYQNLANVSEVSQNGQFDFPHSSDETHTAISDPASALHLIYNDKHKLNDDKKLCKPPIFQPRSFSTPRFFRKITGPWNHWALLQNAKKSFFRGPKRLPFHGNRMSSPRHAAPFPVGFNPRAPPPFISHDLPRAFDPSEPPPNIRPVADACSRQENALSSMDPRSQAINSSQTKINIVKPSHNFDPRGPPPRILSTTVQTTENFPEFNPQQPPPKIHKREETFQPPSIFDSQLSSREYPNLNTPLESVRSNLMPMHLRETQKIPDYNTDSVAPKFSQPSLNVPAHQHFVSNVQLNFQSVLPQVNNTQEMMREFSLPPPMDINKLPPPKYPIVGGNSNFTQSINMDDGLEDMQEAMEFAKQVMNMAGEARNDHVQDILPKVPSAQFHACESIEKGRSHLLLEEERNTGTITKKNKTDGKDNHNNVCGSELVGEKQGEVHVIDEESIQNKSKHREDTLLANDQIRPKVVFNLNSKQKKIHKSDEWHRTSTSMSENSYQGASCYSNKGKVQGKNHSSETSKSSSNQNKDKQSNSGTTINSSQYCSNINASLEEKSYHKNNNLNKLHSYPTCEIVCDTMNSRKSQSLKKDNKNAETPSLETSWKNKVISRFLKMSKNDIFNMVNNSSLRKFDIAMEHLVKERKSALSLEMRNTEDEKMKEYDREEFMNQLNAMLDPCAVVAITDLPTEFIHHLSEVLQLDVELPENQNIDFDKANFTNKNEISRLHTSECSDDGNPKMEPYIGHSKPQNICGGRRELKNKSICTREESPHFSLPIEVKQNLSRDDTNSSQTVPTNKINMETENAHKKQQQPLFNEADLDDILSEVTGKAKNLACSVALFKPGKSTEIRTLVQAVDKEAFEYNTFSPTPNKKAAELDGIFSSKVTRVKLQSKNNSDSNNSRGRKSSSEDRNTSRSERHERWNRKEWEDPDTFRNLTKEEWEAKYGAKNNSTGLNITRKSASCSAENLSRDNCNFHSQRYCSSESPMRYSSLSPSTREVPAYKISHSNKTEELQMSEGAESSSDYTSSSSSDCDEETVAPNVTKLLKVIKEKEKIAKNRSLNETIRDEVAAEIEKKWKEKSRYKKRKFRRREKKGRDKRERRREDNKWRKRNSPSGSSKTGEHLDDFRLPVDRIKEEVIVKEEPMSSFGDNVLIDSLTESICAAPSSMKKIVDTQIQSQSSQLGSGHAPKMISDIMLQPRDIVVIATTQPKTKAQLKQMPEFNGTNVKRSMQEETAGVVKIADNRGILQNSSVATKDHKTLKNINKQINAALSTSVPAQQTKQSINAGGTLCNPVTIENANNSNNAINLILPTNSISNSVAEINTTTQSTVTNKFKSCAIETKSSGYKKIDIKAYKERALQRRSKEEAMLKEDEGSSASAIQDIQSSLSNKINVDSRRTINQVKTSELDVNQIEVKDSPLTEVKSTNTQSLVVSNKEIEETSTEKFVEQERQSVDPVPKNTEFSTCVQLKNTTCERNATDLVEVDLNFYKKSVAHTERKNRSNSSAQQTTHTPDLKESRVKENPPVLLPSKEKKSKKSIPANEFCKFKNIRSEGSKELKLKKELAKSYTMKKKKDLKLNESNVLVAGERLIVKCSLSKLSGSNYESLNVKSIDNSKKAVGNANKDIFEEKHVINKEVINNKGNQKSASAENKTDDVKRLRKFASTSYENLSKQKDASSAIQSINCSSFDHDNSISIEQHIENAVPPVSDYITDESPSLNDCTDVAITKNDPIVAKSSNYVAACRNSTADTKIDSEVLKNLETLDPGEQSKVKFVTQCLRNSDNCGRVLENEEKSPDSPSSPFMGFMAESVQIDTYQVPQSCGLEACNESDKENSKSSSSQLLETCFTDKHILEFANVNQDNEKRCSKKLTEEKDRVLVRNLMKKQNDPIKRLNNYLGDTGSINIETTMEIENKNIIGEENQRSNILTYQQTDLSVPYIDSDDTFDEGGESFIVLDEYIDGTDRKSIGKLSALSLDLEECTARDADMFMDKSMQGEENGSTDINSAHFNPMDFKDLTEEFDKNSINIVRDISNAELFSSDKKITVAADIVSSTSESNIIPASNLLKIKKVIDTAVSATALESFQNIVSTTSKDTSRKSVTSESSAEVRPMEENVKSPDTTKNNKKKLFENEISQKLLNSVETETETVIVPGTKVETLEPYEQDIRQQEGQQMLNYSFPSEKMLVFPQIIVDSVADKKTSKSTSNMISNQSVERGGQDALHKIKSRSKMKHKKQKNNTPGKILKEVVKSDEPKIKYPSTKDAIMARMIEIDVEIHKLMTEKMTLYQILTNNALPANNDLQKNNLIQVEHEVQNIKIGTPTPPALMSHILQNIETNPVTNQSIDMVAEYPPKKENTDDPTQANKTETPLIKREHQTEKKENCISTCGFDDEMNRLSEDRKSCKKRKKEKNGGVVKNLQYKLNTNLSEYANIDKESREITDVTKLTSKKMIKKQLTLKGESSAISLTEAQSKKNVYNMFSKRIRKDNGVNSDKIDEQPCQEIEKISEFTKSETLTDEIIPERVPKLGDESPSSKYNEESIGDLNEKIANANSPARPSESRTPERSSIYSDDSTWDSLLQTSSADDQKKINTGLALLEETYRREMAKTRRAKAEVRKRKRKKLQNLLQTAHTLTPEEEELPLSALYIKKFYQNKKADALDRETKEQENEQWTNLDDVINAVAENRTENLEVQSKELLGVTEDTTCDVPNSEKHTESEENKRQTIHCIMQDIKGISIPAFVKNVEISCQIKNLNNTVKDRMCLPCSISQEFINNEHLKQNLELSPSLKSPKLTAVTYQSNTSAYIAKDPKEFWVEQYVKKSVGDDGNHQQTSTEISGICFTVSSSNNRDDNQNISKAVKNPSIENVGKNEGLAKEMICSSQNAVSTTENMESQECTDSNLIVIRSGEKNTDNSDEFNNVKQTTTTNEIHSKNNSNCTMLNVHDDKSNDSIAFFKKNESGEVAVPDKLNYISQDERLICYKEHDESHKRKEMGHCSRASSEQRDNQESASVSKNDETLCKKSCKRKRESSKTALRRSSRYTDELPKCIKSVVDINVHNLEQELQTTNIRKHHSSSTSSSPCEEIENLLTNSRHNRIQNLGNNRKRYTSSSPEVEVISNQLNQNNGSPKGVKRYKQCAIEMMNCAVQLIDCRHTILNPNAGHNLLQNYGISRINANECFNSIQVNSSTSSMQFLSTKDLSNNSMKQTSRVTEFSKIVATKSDQIHPAKAKKVLKPVKLNLSIIDQEVCTVPDVDVMPVLTKEPVTANISQNCEKPDIEVVEEKKIVTKDQQHNSSGSISTVIDTKDDKELPRTQYTVHKGPILDIKVFENSFLAASEDGRIYRYNQASNGILNIYKGHKAAVTCLYVYNSSSTDIISREWMFSGSLDGTLRCYNVMTGIQVRETADIGSPIQCMDEAWGIIFIGTKSGHVSRYHIKSGAIKGNRIQFSDKSVLALKATNEGPRRVLIVASRSQPITIRDAQSGLFLRTICGQKSHTVYSLMRDHNLIYCGTSSTSIPVFDFTNGEQTMQYHAGVGIVCMRLFKQLLFAGCYDGNIYVFDTKEHRLICSIPGPGNMLLSMEVVGNKIIAGSKDKRLQSWPMPWQARSVL